MGNLFDDGWLAGSEIRARKTHRFGMFLKPVVNNGIFTISTGAGEIKCHLFWGGDQT